MKLIKFEPEHLELFDWRDDEYKMYNIDGDFLRALSKQEGEFYTLIDAGRIVCFGGLVKYSKRTAYGVTVFSKWAGKSAARYVKRHFLFMAKDMGLRRVTTHNRAFYDAFGLPFDKTGHNAWCEWLGFKFEGIEHAFDDDGNDYSRYGMVLNGN